MDIENQLLFIKNERQRHTDAVAALNALEATITDKIAPQIASIDGLNASLAWKQAEIDAIVK